MMSATSADTSKPINPANTLDLDYRALAAGLPYSGPIYDVHTHLANVPAARAYFRTADRFNVTRTWTMTQLEQVGPLREAFGDRLRFIAVPNHRNAERHGTFTTDWLRRIEAFADQGVRICKFWAAPRGRDFHRRALRIDTRERREQMRLARSLGMMFMTHIADPDTWFATHYADARHYGTKAAHYAAFERALEKFGDVPWLAAHMAGHPEDLEHVQRLLDRYPHLYIDTAATKWMVRELSRHADAFADFCRRNTGRVLFGSDIVALESDTTPDLYDSRYWALRTLIETDYDGPSPIVDPDLALLDPDVGEHPTAHLRGGGLDRPALDVLYRDAAVNLLEAWEAGTWRTPDEA